MKEPEHKEQDRFYSHGDSWSCSVISEAKRNLIFIKKGNL